VLYFYSVYRPSQITNFNGHPPPFSRVSHRVHTQNHRSVPSSPWFWMVKPGNARCDTVGTWLQSGWILFTQFGNADLDGNSSVGRMVDRRCQTFVSCPTLSIISSASLQRYDSVVFAVLWHSNNSIWSLQLCPNNLPPQPFWTTFIPIQHQSKFSCGDELVCGYHGFVSCQRVHYHCIDASLMQLCGYVVFYLLQ